MATPSTHDSGAFDLDEQWQVLLHFLPAGWQDAVWTYGAIKRRWVIDSAEALLRLIFVYAWNDWSLRIIAVWAGRIGIGEMLGCGGAKPLAPIARVARSPAQPGLPRTGHGTTVKSRFRLVLTDGSTIQRPGSTGTTWRLHGQWNLGTSRWEHVVHGSESFTRLHLQPHDVVLRGRNYAKPKALAWIVDQEADVVARFGWNALRGQTLDGEVSS